jgi:hypothetical protein
VNRILTKGVGFYQLIVGGYGALYMLFLAVRAGGISLLNMMILGLLVLLVAAGAALLKKPKLGRRLSIVAQVFQVPFIDTARFGYQLAAGIAAWCRLSTAGVSFPTAFGVSWHVRFSSGFGPAFENHPIVLGVNLVPLLIIGYLYYSGRRSGKAS